jgi:penicillin-binding protein 1A
LFLQGLIAIEDSHFFEHPGIDPAGILRALYVNLRSGRTAQGGSTLTQQLAKLLFLKPDKTIERKLQEAMLAVKLEQKYTKQEILRMYCNHIFLGHGVYGIHAAAKYYFGKAAKDLNLQEAALLASMPKAPQTFSPYSHPSRALVRRNHVLLRMAEENFITEQQYKHTIRQPISVRTQYAKKSFAPYYMEEIRKQLEEKHDYKSIYEGGLQIYSTLDSRMQKMARKALDVGLRKMDKRHGWRKVGTTLNDAEMETYWSEDWTGKYELDQTVEGLVLEVKDRLALIKIEHQIIPLKPDGWRWTNKKHCTAFLAVGNVTDFRIKEIKDNKIISVHLDQPPVVNGAIVAMDVKTGKIRALVGGSDFGTRKFNCATQAYRQTGSSFKPFVYAAALEKGYTPSDVLVDSPISYYDRWTKRTWSPQNYSHDFLGPITLRRALELSRNTVAVKLLERIGVGYAIRYINKFKVSNHMKPYLPLALGASESTLIDMVRGYDAFANHGLMMEPYYIERILDGDGNLLEENLPSAKEALRADVAYLMTQMLRGVISSGTGKRATVLKRPVAGKTGTTDNFEDAWFIGYTPSLICGVWVGFNEKKSLGKKQTGARAALPIWIDFMKAALKGKPVEDFQPTANIQTILIDRRTGLRATPDCTDVTPENFIAGTEPSRFCPFDHSARPEELTVE